MNKFTPLSDAHVPDIQRDPEKNKKWYLTFLCLPTFLKLIHSMLGTFNMDVLMYESIVKVKWCYKKK